MGEMQAESDAQRLRDYAERGNEAAFREIVTRHTDLVYSAALRQVDSSDLAADITQKVFVDLARKAKPVADRLAAEASLAGWLHRASRYAALNHLRDHRRRLANERQAMNQLLTNAESSADWEQIRPVLDEALDSLGDEDREALLLRYFKNQDFRAVGLALGVSDDAAQKRVSRAVDRLREFFSKRNVTIGASGLAVLISANAVQSAPIGLAAAISTAVLAGAAVQTSTVIAATKTIAMTALQKTLITATVAVLAGGGIYEAKQTADARAEVQTLQQQQAPLAGQIRQLRQERDDATNRLAALEAENAQLQADQNEAELLKLRGNVARLQDTENDPFVKLALAFKAKKEKLLQLFAERPEFYVPEIQLLNDKDWLDIIRKADRESTNWFDQTIAGKSDEEIKQSGIGSALGDVIQAALKKFAPMVQEALKSFMDSHAGQRPGAISDLKPYFEPPVDNAMLNQYKLLSPGIKNPLFGDKDLTDSYVVTRKEGVDFANPLCIGPNGYYDVLAAEVAELNGILKPITGAFAAANHNAMPSSLSQMEPYIITPDQQKAFDDYNKLLKSIQINFPWFHYP